MFFLNSSSYETTQHVCLLRRTEKDEFLLWLGHLNPNQSYNDRHDLLQWAHNCFYTVYSDPGVNQTLTIGLAVQMTFVRVVLGFYCTSMRTTSISMMVKQSRNDRHILTKDFHATMLIFYIDALVKLGFTFLSVKQVELKLNTRECRAKKSQQDKMMMYRRELSLQRDVVCHFCTASSLKAERNVKHKAELGCLWICEHYRCRAATHTENE